MKKPGKIKNALRKITAIPIGLAIGTGIYEGCSAVSNYNNETKTLISQINRHAAGEDRILSAPEARTLLDNSGFPTAVLNEGSIVE